MSLCATSVGGGYGPTQQLLTFNTNSGRRMTRLCCFCTSQASDGFQKLQYLLMQNPFPPETFGNLLLLYCKYEYYDLAADVLAENADLTYRYLTPVC